MQCVLFFFFFFFGPHLAAITLLFSIYDMNSFDSFHANNCKQSLFLTTISCFFFFLAGQKLFEPALVMYNAEAFH